MLLAGVFSFEWDTGNIAKIKKRISLEDVELFFNHPLTVLEDKKNSKAEQRHIAVGYSFSKRPMFVCFTIRGTTVHPKIRVISCRYMHKNEMRNYGIFKKSL